MLTFSCVLADFCWKLLMVRNRFFLFKPPCNPVQFSSIQFSAVQCCAVQCCAVQLTRILGCVCRATAKPFSVCARATSMGREGMASFPAPSSLFPQKRMLISSVKLLSKCSLHEPKLAMCQLLAAYSDLFSPEHISSLKDFTNYQSPQLI
jgi:hypothetical protein